MNLTSDTNPFQLEEALALLEVTPSVLRSLLGPLPHEWLHFKEDPHAWSPYTVLVHLVHNERTNWIPRVRVVLSEENVRSQIKRTEELITNVIGSRPALFRPPYGSLTPHQKHFIHDELGYEIILWDVDPLDWKEPGPTVVSNRILKETRPGSIVLSHDIHAQTIQAMPATLTELEAKGFKFVTVSELLKLQTPIPPPTPKSVAPAAAPLSSIAPAPGG